MTVLQTLGLRAANALDAPPNHAPLFLGFHFIFVYVLISSRPLKKWYGLDHQESPREDVAKYGEDAVRNGKITRRQLDTLKRNESAHANSVENFPLLVAGLLFATVVGVPAQTINLAGWSYTLARIVYGAVYIPTDDPTLAGVRGLVWWAGNVACLSLLWSAAKLL